MEIKLPKEFQIFGHKITIEIDNERMNDHNNYGLCIHDTNSIILATHNKEGRAFAPELIQTTMWHEIVHHILEKLRYRKLSNNEKFVCQMAEALHQVTKTLK